MSADPSGKFKFSKDERTENSLNHSIKDGIAFSAMTGSSETYFAAFAIFLKASAPQVALLASLPPLLASFAQIFAVFLGQRTGARKQVVIVGAAVQFLALGCIALLPVLFNANQFLWLLGLVILYFIGPNLGAPLWGSLMGAIVPTATRGRFFAARTRLSSFASFAALIVAGLILQFFDMLAYTYYGFVAIFSLGVIARMISTWHLGQLHDPPHTHALAGDVTNLFHRNFFRGEHKFFRYSIFNALMQGAVAISGPLVAVYLLRVLEYSYIQFTFNTAASIVVQFLVLNRWGRLSDLFGNRIILRLTGFTIPVIPVLWVLSTDFYYLLFVQAISGLVWSGFSLSASNFVYDLTDHDKRAGLMAVHAVLSATMVFFGASLGGLLAISLPHEVVIFDTTFHWLTPILGVFMLSALCRLIVASLFLPKLQETRDVRKMSYHGLFFRVTRFSPISGLIFETVSRRNRMAEQSETENNDSDLPR